MRKIMISIDTSDLTEDTQILFSTAKKVLLKEKLRKSLNQTFSFLIEEDEDIYIQFYSENDSFIIELLKQVGFQLIAFFPKSYCYEAWFASFFYKNSVKYKLNLNQRSNYELKYHEASAIQPVKYLTAKWSSMTGDIIEYSEVNEIKKEYAQYTAELLIATGLTLLLAVIWFFIDLNPETVHIKAPPFIFELLLAGLAVTHAGRAWYASYLQYKKIRKANNDLKCFR